MRNYVTIFLLCAALTAATVSAQEPTPTFSGDVLASQAAEESRVDALPTLTAIDAMPVIVVTAAPAEATDEPGVNVEVNVTNPPAAPADVTPTEPATASVPADTVHVALVVGGIVALAVISVAAFLLKTTGEQLYNSSPAIVQYGVRAGGEYLLHEAAKTPQQDDDAAIESALKALGFTVVREEDGAITLRRSTPTPSAVPPMPSTAGMPAGQWVYVQAPSTFADPRPVTTPSGAVIQPTPEAVTAFTEGDGVQAVG